LQPLSDIGLTGSNSQGRDSKFYYGWIIAAVCLVYMTVSSGIRFSFGVFFKPLEADFGLSRASTSGIFSIYSVLAFSYSETPLFCGISSFTGFRCHQVARIEPRIFIIGP